MAACGYPGVAKDGRRKRPVVGLASRLIFLSWAFMIWLDPEEILLGGLIVPAVGLATSLRDLWRQMDDHRIREGQYCRTDA